MVEIKKNPNGDSRTAPKGITFEQFQEANDMHIDDVRKVMYEIAKIFVVTGNRHDYTKKTHEEMFYNDFLDSQENGKNFVEGDWYKLHIKEERHHLLSNCPDNVNLFDIIESIVDCTCAGLARSGEIRDLEFDDEIIKKAIKNTVELVKSMIIVKE